MSTPTTHSTALSSSLRSRRIAQGFAAFCSGCLLLFVVGFMPTSAVHNAAHDTRHAAAFPCH